MRGDANWLTQVAWGQHFFGALFTGRHFPVRKMRALESRGLVTSIGACALCDGDGFIIMPERYRDGWQLTAAGIASLVDSGETHYLWGDWFDRDYRTPPTTQGDSDE